MAKAKRLTNEQCKDLNKILTPGLIHVIKRTFIHAYEKGFSPRETLGFIGAFLTFYGKPDSINELLTLVVTEMLHDETIDDSIIDFPNSDKNFENKSSDTQKTER